MPPKRVRPLTPANSHNSLASQLRCSSVVPALSLASSAKRKNRLLDEEASNDATTHQAWKICDQLACLGFPDLSTQDRARLCTGSHWGSNRAAQQSSTCLVARDITSCKAEHQATAELLAAKMPWQQLKLESLPWTQRRRSKTEAIHGRDQPHLSRGGTLCDGRREQEAGRS